MIDPYRGILSYLNDRNIRVPDGWVPACVDWLKSEYSNLPQSVINLTWLSQKAYEQYLFTDLTELSCSTLPDDISKLAKGILSKTVCLQINFIKEVGLSAYSQLQNFQKHNVENTSFDSDKHRPQSWEPVDSRLLLIELTDGVTTVKSLEYLPISFISINTKPGSKILVKKGVAVRRGVLLLTADHVELLGGAVDSLLVKNAPENVINRNFGLPENTTPSDYVETDIPSTASSTQQTSYYPGSAQQRLIRGAQKKETDATRLGRSTQSNRMNLNCSSQPMNSSIRAEEGRTPSLLDKPRNICTIPDFDDDDDFFMNDEVEAALRQAESSLPVDPKHSDIRNSASSTSLPSVSSSGLTWLGHTPSVTTPSSTSSASTSLRQGSALASNLHQIQPHGALTQLNKKIIGSEDDFPYDFELDDEDFATLDDLQTDKKAVRSAMPSGCASYSSAEKNQDDLKVKSSDNQTNKLKLKSVTYKRSYEQDCFDREMKDDSKMDSISLKTTNSRKSFAISKEDTDSFINVDMQSNLLATSVSEKRSVRDSVRNNPPFTYLCLLPTDNKECQEFTVKAFVMTLVSRLDQSNGDWRLRVKICDGTCSIDVDMHDQVLRKLIGMSVEEMRVLKAKAVTDTGVRTMLIQRISSCQKQLIALNCLMTVRVAASSHPTVVALLELDHSHLQQLRDRLTLH